MQCINRPKHSKLGRSILARYSAAHPGNLIEWHQQRDITNRTDELAVAFEHYGSVAIRRLRHFRKPFVIQRRPLDIRLSFLQGLGMFESSLTTKCFVKNAVNRRGIICGERADDEARGFDKSLGHRSFISY